MSVSVLLYTVVEILSNPWVIVNKFHINLWITLKFIEFMAYDASNVIVIPLPRVGMQALAESLLP